MFTVAHRRLTTSCTMTPDNSPDSSYLRASAEPERNSCMYVYSVPQLCVVFVATHQKTISIGFLCGVVCAAIGSVIFAQRHAACDGQINGRTELLSVSCNTLKRSVSRGSSTIGCPAWQPRPIYVQLSCVTDVGLVCVVERYDLTELKEYYYYYYYYTAVQKRSRRN